MKATFDEPWSIALLKLLADREWHDYETVMDQIGSFVPDELAFEKGEYYRIYHFLRRGDEIKPRRTGGISATVRSGQRIVLGRTIRSLALHERVIVQTRHEPGKRPRPMRLRLSVDPDAFDE